MDRFWEKSIEKVNEEIIKLKSEGTEKTSHTSQNSSIRQNTQATADTDNDLQKKIGDAYTTEISAEGYNALTNSQTNSINNFYSSAATITNFNSQELNKLQYKNITSKTFSFLYKNSKKIIEEFETKK